MATRKLHKYTEEVNVGWGGYVLVKYCRLMVEVFIKFCIKNIYKETYFSLFIYIYIYTQTPAAWTLDAKHVE